MNFLKKNYSFLYLLYAVILLLLLSVHSLSPALFCLLIIAHMLVVLTLDLYSIEFAIVSSLAILLVGSIFSPKPFLTIQDGVSGFSDQTVFIVAALFVVARGVQNAGVMHSFLKVVLGRASSAPKMLLRLSLPLMSLSAFLNNTPLVAIFTPYVKEWALKNKISPSKVLIPLSYITIFGGLFTLIGTSTNLLVVGLANNVPLLDSLGSPLFYENGQARMLGSEISFFAPSCVAIPCAILGVLYIYFFGNKLLPDRADLLQMTKTQMKPYIFALEVSKGSRYHGQTILDSGLREFEDCFLFEVHRNDEVYSPVKGTFLMKEGDILYFKGSQEHVIELSRKSGVIIPGQIKDFEIGAGNQYLEVIVAPSSPLIGKTIDELWFNRTYDATVLAFHRNGETIENQISKIPLKMGDTLILLAGKGFRRIWQNSKVFNFGSPIRDDLVKNQYTWFALIGLFLMVVLPELHNFIPQFPKIPLSITSIVCACLFIQFYLVEKNAFTVLLEWGVLIVIGASFGLSKALQESGAAALVGELIYEISGNESPWVALTLIALGTTILTEMITNNAAAAIFFPLAVTTANALHVNPMPFVMVVMIAASCSFATPFGYQTNMMVYGPGNYKTKDYLKIGLPLNFLYFITTIIMAPMIWPF